jgi:excisionase family DNA binding protein
MFHEETLEGFLTVNELARQLKVGRKQIYKLIDAGALSAIRLGPRLYRIPVTAARQLLVDLRVAPPRP